MRNDVSAKLIAHERVSYGDVRLPSDRRFGFWMAALFAGLAGYLTIKQSQPALVMLNGAAAALFAFAAALAPHRLATLNRGWFALGQLLARVINPLVIGAMFLLFIAPVAVLGRLLGRDPLRLRKGNDSTYWVADPVRVVSPDSFTRQF